MSRRIDKSWVVFDSIENNEHDSCVDFFYRPDGSFGFDTFRRDIEDAGEWTPLGYFSSSAFASANAAYDAAEAAVPWLADILGGVPARRRAPSK